MEQSGWLRVLLEKMDRDIEVIKRDVQLLSEFKWRVAGGVTVFCAVITFAIQAIAIWLKR